MWDPTPPAFVAQMRLQMAACPSVQQMCGGAANALARGHYPSININGKDGAPDPLPAYLITRTAGRRQKWIEGAGGLVQGSFDLDLYAPPLAAAGVATAYTIGALEDLAETIIAELLAQRSGIPFSGTPSIGEATNPSNAALAANSAANPTAYRHIRITLPYGYSA